MNLYLIDLSLNYYTGSNWHCVPEKGQLEVDKKGKALIEENVKN